jgi:hypothetical protein
MQRTGFVHVSSMMAFATPARPSPPDHSSAPWNTHWMRTCIHELVPRLKKYPSGILAKRQCVKCGQGVGATVPKAGVTELWDEQLEVDVRSKYDAECAEYKSANDEFSKWQQGEKTREWWSCHAAYMRSAVWAVKREKVLERCGGICESCMQAEARHVHHLKYHDTFGLEPLWYLRAVCVPCHELIHPHMRGG